MKQLVLLSNRKGEWSVKMERLGLSCSAAFGRLRCMPSTCSFNRLANKNMQPNLILNIACEEGTVS